MLLPRYLSVLCVFVFCITTNAKIFVKSYLSTSAYSKKTDTTISNHTTLNGDTSSCDVSIHLHLNDYIKKNKNTSASSNVFFCEFITTWRTSTANEEITIGTSGPGFNYNIDWGDGNTTTGATGDISHTYMAAGDYQVTITGDFPRISFSNPAADGDQILSVDQWGCNPWTSMEGAFIGCPNLVINATDTPNLSNCNSLKQMFMQSGSIGNGTGNWNWDTSNITDMWETFSQVISFNKPIGTWNTANVTTMRSMFAGATSFNQPLDNWDVSSVTVMLTMFAGATNFNQDLNSWDTGNVISMGQMFFQATNFNGDIGNWDVSSVVTMSSMFRQATNFDQNIGNWNPLNVENMQSMFREAVSFNQPIGSWNVSSVENMAQMFITASVFNQNIGAWDTSSVTNMSSMFNTASAFNQPIGNWNTSSVTTMNSMFRAAAAFNGDIGAWDTSGVNVNSGFTSMFEDATSFNQDISNWDITNVPLLNNMFDGASSFNQDISNWDTSNITSMRFLFNEASSFDQDLSAWNMANVSNAQNMFQNSGLSIPNYDAILIGWDAQNLRPNVPFAGFSQYCAGEAARANMIASDNWSISDGGFAGAGFAVLANQTATESYTLPAITGANLTGNEAYYTGPNGTGTQYLPGDVINYEDYASYPITLYIYDNTVPGCESETNFELTINCSTSMFYLDVDNDGFGDPNTAIEACSPPNGYVLDNTDCDDTNATVYLNAPEICDGIDNNCDGQIDEGVTTYYADTDGDGFGDPNIAIEACSPPNGYVLDNTDCDDTNAMVYLNAPEICDGIDNNCNGQIDEGVTTTYYADTDGDGFGDPNTAIEACSPPNGYVLANTDCDDTNATVYFNAPELCDGIDNNCDGVTETIITLNTIVDQVVNYTFTFPEITGINLSGNEAFYTATGGNGTSYNPGDIINYQDFTAYPITLYAYDSNADGCDVEVSFQLTILSPPLCTTLINPLNNATNVPVDTDFTWNAVNNATGYRINLGTDTVFYGEFDVGNNTTFNGLGFDLPPNTLIYVRIIPYNDDGDAVGSCDNETFTTGNLPLQCTQLIAPLDGATNVAVDANLDWNAIPDAIGYILNVGTTSNGTDIVDNLNVGNVLSYNFPIDLPENTEIFVTIIPFSANGQATNCSEEHFFTEDVLFPPSCTVMASPNPGAVDVPITTTISWTTSIGATGYILSVGTSANGVDIVDNVIVGNVLSYDLPNDLPEGTEIFVTVTPFNFDGEAENCLETSFTTASTPVPPECTFLINPLSGSSDISVNTVVNWEAVEDAQGYLISMGTSVGGTDIVDNVDVGNTLMCDFQNQLPYETSIFVTITPYNEVGVAFSCSSESFVTQIRTTLIPNYFTPNGDGVNDRWIVQDQTNLIKEIVIFNRYGKALNSLSGFSSTWIWDGTYNGNLLPTSDYWYLISYNDGQLVKGHFSLIR